MNIKKGIVKLVLGFSIIAGILEAAPSEAITLSLNLGDTQKSIKTWEIVPVHFKEYKNDFGGFIYFLGDDVANADSSSEDDEGGTGDGGGDTPEEPTEPVEVDANDYEYKINGSSCKTKKKGFYYNAERGERLWPLDDETASNRGFFEKGINMSGGIFGNCTADLDEYINRLQECGDNPEGGENTEDCYKEVEESYMDYYSYYGVVTHEYSGQKFALAVGVSYDTGNPWIEMKPKLGKTFQYHPGVKHPFGFIYDYNGGVGFAGCEILGNNGAAELHNIIQKGVNEKGITQFFVESGSVDETPYLVYTGGEGKFKCKDIGQDMNSSLMILVEGLIGMGNNTESYKTKDKNIQKSQYFASININNATLINHARQRAEILCRGKRNDNAYYHTAEGINCIIGPYTLTESDRNRTIIVKNGNVTIKPFSQNENKYYDVFIDSGNLIIDEGTDDSDSNKFVIKSNGFVDNGYTKDDFRQAVDDIKNDENGINEHSYDGLTHIGVASILKGNFIVNGHIKGASSDKTLENKYFIYGKLTSLDDNNSLKATFRWSCEGEDATDTYPCPFSPQTGPNRHSYQNAPLVIIDQNYDSPLFK